MRKLAMWLLGSALLMAALPQVGSANGVSVTAFGGTIIPLGKFGDDNLQTASKVGYQFGGSVDYEMKSFAIGVDASYNKGKGVFEGQTFVTETVAKAEVKTVQVGVHGKYLIPVAAPVHPYVLLGLGAYNSKYHEDDTDTISGPSSFDINNDTHVGGKLGVGARWAFQSMWAVGAEANYNVISADKNKGFGFESLQYVGLTAGLTWMMPTASK
jgi:opacity protein-like surface antigen